MFVLALVHTFPFLIVHIKKGVMITQWKTSVVYWTGVATLIPQAWLNIMSIGVIRNRYYEFFKATHFLAIGFFIVFFFIHCDFRFTSWTTSSLPSLYATTYMIHVVVAVRTSDSAYWVMDELKQVLESSTRERIQMDIHITDEGTYLPADSKLETSFNEDSEKNIPKRTELLVSNHPNIALIRGKGRPDLKEPIRNNTREAPREGG